MIDITDGLFATRFLSVCLQTSLLLMSIFHTGISSVKADVRCYCNLPACVTSGYMCKSSVGVCISDHFGFNGDLWQSRHTCMELVSENEQQMATLNCPQKLPQLVLEMGTYPQRLCCREDMCNYFRNAVDSQDTIRLNQSYMTGFLTNDDFFYRHGNKNNRNNNDIHQQVWFKAAVIAVPIAGGFILIMLIIMAARMLHADHKRHKEWSELRRLNRLNTHVVYSDCQKSLKNSLMCLPKSLSCAVLSRDSLYRYPRLHKSFTSMGSLGQSNNLYKNVSIALSTDTGCTDNSKDNYFVFDL